MVNRWHVDPLDVLGQAALVLGLVRAKGAKFRGLLATLDFQVILQVAVPAIVLAAPRTSVRSRATVARKLPESHRGGPYPAGHSRRLLVLPVLIVI